MSDKDVKDGDPPPVVEVKVVSLTAEQIQFLAECEEDFKDRYTESDAEFMAVKEKSSNVPPILDPWYNKPRRNFDWASRRGGGGGDGGRDYNQGGRHNQGGGYRQHRQNREDNYRRDDRYGGHRQADRYQQRHRPY